MPLLAANIRKAAAAATLQFDWLLPADRPMLKVAEVVALTGMRTTWVEEYFAEKCHRYTGEESKRPPMRIPRAFVLELLVASAKYTAEEKVLSVESLASEFSPEECLRIAATFQRAAFRDAAKKFSPAASGNALGGTSGNRAQAG
jgi:hypothetical protein